MCKWGSSHLNFAYSNTEMQIKLLIINKTRLGITLKVHHYTFAIKLFVRSISPVPLFNIFHKNILSQVFNYFF